MGNIARFLPNSIDNWIGNTGAWTDTQLNALRLAFQYSNDFEATNKLSGAHATIIREMLCVWLLFNGAADAIDNDRPIVQYSSNNALEQFNGRDNAGKQAV